MISRQWSTPILKIGDIGVDENTPAYLTKHVMASNYVAASFVFIGTPYIFLFPYWGIRTLGYVTLPIVLTQLSGLLLNSRRLYTTARLTILVPLTLAVGGYSLCLGHEAGVHQVFFALAVIPFVLFSRVERTSLVGCAAFVLFAAVATEAVRPSSLIYDLGPKYTLICSSLIRATTFVMLLSEVIYLFVLNAAFETKLLHSMKMASLGEMAGGVAHEINTPLAIIKILARQIDDSTEKEPLENPVVRKAAEKIDLTVDRIAKVVAGLRAFSRDGRRDSMQAENLLNIMENTLALCQAKARERGVEFSVRTDAPSLYVMCRASEIAQILVNLINNSLDAIEAAPKKWIRIEVHAFPSATELSVTDSGTGIPSPTRDRLFQPFFTTKEIGKGTGLGLSISHGLAKSNQGDLLLDTHSPNTRFVLKLRPAHEAPS